VAMAVARALAAMKTRPRRSVAFLFFAAEEQGVKGSEYYLQHPLPALANARAFINLDGVGRGRRLEALAGKNYPQLWKYFAAANREWVHAAVSPAYFHNRARPRLDAARFMWAGVPTVSFAAYGAPDLPYPVYHTSHDRPEILTPQIMVDLGRLIFSAVIQLADSE
jgi:Zn-dependent M28 family amino/carboxypeptidase